MGGRCDWLPLPFSPSTLRLVVCQETGLCGVPGWWLNTTKAHANRALIDTGAVSYTHLDVYKRQLGGTFQVNVFSSSNQITPSIAMDSNGDFVVAWASFGQSAPNTYGIYARRFTAAGVAKDAGDIAVNTTTGYRTNPSCLLYTSTWLSAHISCSSCSSLYRCVSSSRSRSSANRISSRIDR